MSKHVIKYEYHEGTKLKKPVLWCGGKANSFDWYFQDAQHVALAVGGSTAPCKNCIRAVIRQLQKEL